MCFLSVGLPGCVCVGEDGAYELFVGGSDVFFGVSECCVCEGPDDIQPGFGFCVDCVGVIFECHPSVECDS